MPEITKTQPWKAHWPPPSTVEKGPLVGKKAGDILEVDGQGGAGSYAYNNKGEGVGAPKGANVHKWH